MNNIETTEELMLFLINLFGKKFPQSAILKGGRIKKPSTQTVTEPEIESFSRRLKFLPRDSFDLHYYSNNC
jgi:hypothetical protein